MHPSLYAITQFLDRFLAVACFPPERIDLPLLTTPESSVRTVTRLGLALEPWPGLRAWVEQEQLEALFLHRPWGLTSVHVPDGVGVIAYHRPFDARLTVGWNPRLADALGLTQVEWHGVKEGVPLGMLGTCAPTGWPEVLQRVTEIFGGVETVQAPQAADVRRMVVVGAMTDALVRLAAARGASVYVTGQWRTPARRAVEETQLGVIAVGHRRSEAWGLRALAGALRERWNHLTVTISP